MAIHPLPPTAADIGPVWLTEVLHGSGGLSAEGRVKEVTWEKLGEGAGMMSDLARLRMTYEGDAGSAPATLVVKQPSAVENNRLVAVKYNTYAREVRYFAELDPVCAAQGPGIHLSEIDPDNNFVILMDDLSDYHIGDQIVGADLPQSEVCVDELAKLHGSFWAAADDLDWLPHIHGSEHAGNMISGAQIGWDTMLKIFGEFVPDAINGERERFLDSIGPLQHRLDTPPITVLHGDFRMDNLFFGQNPEQHPLIMLDWQGPLRGRGIYDVAQLLVQSAQTEVRRSQERQLVERYVQKLTDQGVTGYGFDQAWEDYRVATLYLWAYVVVVSGTLEVGSERAFAWMSKMVQRNASAIEDLDCLSLL